MEPKEREQIVYLQWLRVFAAAAVVLMHMAAKQWNAVSFETDGWLALTAWDSLVRWPVQVFIMITGAIFLPRKTELRTVLTRYIPRLAVVFVVWSGIHVLYSLYRGDTSEDALLRFVTGHYHLWYLPFLCGVYLAIPFVQRIVTDGRLMKQLLIVSLVVGLVIPWLADAGALMWPEHGPVLRSIENSLNFAFFLDHLAFLLLGHWLHQTELSPRSRGWLYMLGLLGAAVTGVGTVWASNHAGANSSVFFDHAAPNNICAAAALFVFAKYNLHRLPKAVDRMAKWSFGVYLCHAFFIDVLADKGIHVLAWNPVWSVPVLAAAVFAVSLALTALLAKIPLVGKYLT